MLNYSSTIILCFLGFTPHWLANHAGMVIVSRRSNTGTEFSCPNCAHVYSYKKNLKRHLKYECGKDPTYICPYCPHRTKYKASLKTHISLKHADHIDEYKLFNYSSLVPDTSSSSIGPDISGFPDQWFDYLIFNLHTLGIMYTYTKRHLQFKSRCVRLRCPQVV